MLISLTTLLATLSSIFRSRAALELENLALRHQIGVLQRFAAKRPKLTSGDRLLWVCLSRLWRDWRDWRAALAIVKLGIDIGESSVSKYLVRCPHTAVSDLAHIPGQLVSIDFFTVPTIRFQVLYVFLVLAHDRRRILHFNVTAHPTAEWTGQQLREAFPFDQLPGIETTSETWDKTRTAWFGSLVTPVLSNLFNPSSNPRSGRLARIYKYLAVPGGLVSCCKYWQTHNRRFRQVNFGRFAAHR